MKWLDKTSHLMLVNSDSPCDVMQNSVGIFVWSVMVFGTRLRVLAPQFIYIHWHSICMKQNAFNCSRALRKVASKLASYIIK